MRMIGLTLRGPPWRTREAWARTVLLSALWSLGTAVVAVASEPAAELPAGGLTYIGPPQLVTEREDIVIAPNRVRATSIVRNPGDDARTATVAFALPDIDILALDGAAIDNPAYDPQNPSNYVGFAATVDGQTVEMFVQVSAQALGLIDQTALLKSHNLPLYPLHPDLGERLAALPEAARAELSARSLMRPADDQFEAVWTLKSTLFWQQAFAARQVRTMTISYQPIAGSAPWTAEAAATFQQRYCVSDAAARDLSARATQAEPVTVRWVHYLLYAGAAARGTIGQHRVAIEVPAGVKAFTCHSGLNSTFGAARETTLTNHVADGEVQVLFIE